MSVVPLSGLVHKTTNSRLPAKKSHEFCLGAGLMLTNRKDRPRILENFPFCVKFDINRSSKVLRSGILQPTLHDFDIAALADMGLLEPQYLTFNSGVKAFTFKAALKARIPEGFTVMEDILIYCDKFSRVIVPTFDTIMYMIAADESLPEPLRIKAINSYSSAPERNIFRSAGPYYDELSSALIKIENRARQLDNEGGNYTPQSGNLSSCVHAKDAVQVCVSDVLDTMVETASTPIGILDPLVEWCGLPNDPLVLAIHLATFRTPVYSVIALLAMYVLVSFIRDFCLTVRFIIGFLTGGILTSKTKKPVSLFDKLYSPQAGVLTSDDGAAFKGTQEKKSAKFSGASVPASASSPGTTVIPTLGFSQPVRTAPPKPTRKDPNDGPLNGFGVGI